MNILVPVKRVIDHAVKIRINPNGSGVETAHVKMSMNPFDEIAVEEALRLKERGVAQTVVLVSIGDASTVETLRHGLALGADRAIHITCVETPDSLDIAKILKKIVEKESPKLVIMGKQAIDDDCNQVGQMLAGLLDWPQATFASKLTLTGENLEVDREIDGGIETLALTLPAVTTTDLRLNQPRYAALPNIMKARQKPLETLSLESLGYTLRQRQKTIEVREPLSRKGGIQVASISELISHLEQVIP